MGRKKNNDEDVGFGVVKEKKKHPVHQLVEKMDKGWKDLVAWD